MSKRLKRYLFRLIAALISVGVVLLLQRLDLIPAANYYPVLAVLDGDTIVVDMAGRPQTIRLIGVDTPETHHPDIGRQCYGAEASNFTAALLENKTVLLLADSESTNRDRYERLLRYVISEDGTNVNSELLRSGFGFAITSFNHSQMEYFVALQGIAQSKDRGLWATCEIDYGGEYLQTQQINNSAD